ncbi:YkvA family protein [Leptothermofonsia sp. ETS-13]|uniref:YkvA family protein n=1 Tax=Leptothermofonsia sp. ETS-13 TaxID=3035696 RepID=UPI003BA02FDF
MKFLIQPLYKLYRTILRNSKYRWLVVAGSLLYLLSPVDLVTDLIPVVGWLDDGVIATLLVTELSQVVLEQRRARKEKQVEVSA